MHRLCEPEMKAKDPLPVKVPQDIPAKVSSKQGVNFAQVAINKCVNLLIDPNIQLLAEVCTVMAVTASLCDECGGRMQLQEHWLLGVFVDAPALRV